MGRARGGNALLEAKGGHQVGDGAFQRPSLDAAHSKVEVAASVAGTRLPNQTKPNRRPPEQMSEAHVSHAWLPRPLNLKNLALAYTRAQFLDAKGDSKRTRVFSSATEGRVPR